MPAVNPRGGEPQCLGRRVVVVEALRGVQDLLRAKPEPRQRVEQIAEIARSGLYEPISCAVQIASKATPSFRLLPAKLSRSTFERMTSL